MLDDDPKADRNEPCFAALEAATEVKAGLVADSEVECSEKLLLGPWVGFRSSRTISTTGMGVR